MMLRPAFIFVLLIFAVKSLPAQDFSDEAKPDFRTYVDPTGWEITVPQEAKEETGEGSVRWNAFYDRCWLQWSVGLDEKDAQIHFHIPLKMRYGGEYNQMPSE